MPEINDDWDHLDFRNRHADYLIPTQQSTKPTGILFPDDSNGTYRVIMRLPGWDNKREICIGKIPSLDLARKIADTLSHFTGTEPVHNTIAYLHVNPLPVNDDLQSFSRREEYLEYSIRIGQGGQEYQAKRKQYWEWLHKVVEKVRENHCNDGQNEEADDYNNFIPVDDALTGGLEMWRNEIVMFDPVEVDEEEDEEEGGGSHGNQATAGLPQDQIAESACEPPITVPVRNILLDEEIVSLPLEISAEHYLEFLEAVEAFLLHPSGSTRAMLYKMSTILCRLAQDLKVLMPPNDSILGPDFDISRFACKKRILDELRIELRQVLCRCSSEVISSGVFVCTSTPYPPYLVMMAEEMVRGIPPSA